jgi:aldoxime dehydratase
MEETAMESAIPNHLARFRTQALGTPAGFRPPVPAWTARFDPLVKEVVMAYIGVQQAPGSTPSANPLASLAPRFAHSAGPKHWDLSGHVDSAGYHTLIYIAYWDDPGQFQTWRAESQFDAWWYDAARDDEDCGYFLEMVTPSADRFETLFSSPDRPEGIGRLQAGVSGEIAEHNYWGAARDRLALAQTDLLAPEACASQTTRGLRKRVVVPGRANLSLIRSGQDWSDTTGTERALYLSDIEPTLRAGMDFLSVEGAAIGCLSCRYMRVLDAAGMEMEKTFGLAIFDSLGNLEAWAKSHPTHVAIFQGFLKYVQDLNFQIALRLFHEITVVPVEGQYFEYLNCHPGTGLLGPGPAP